MQSARRFLYQSGGVRLTPQMRSERHLSGSEREEISRGIAVGESARQLAERLGRSPSTVSREIARNGGRDRYRAASADAAAYQRGRRPAVAADKTAVVRTVYLESRSIAALARDHHVSRGAIRTAPADLLPEHTAIEEDAPAPELPVTLDTPGKVADIPLSWSPPSGSRSTRL
nr:helix-turn-helix domain-containing protein [Streptomyces daghestanicus]